MDPKKMDEFIERNNAKIRISTEVEKRIYWALASLVLSLLLMPFNAYIGDLPMYVLLGIALAILICTWLYEQREKKKII